MARRTTIQDRPNILFITTDQHHPRYLGVHDPGLRTPNLDRLCREGTLLTRSYASCPTCTPARATWITGQYAYRHGAWQIGTSLEEDCLSLPALLGEAGYRTAMFGKSHLQPCQAWGRSLESPPRRNDTDFFRRWTGPWYGFQHCEINTGHTTEPHSASMHYRAWLEDHQVDIARHFDREDNSSTERWDLPEALTPAYWAADRTLAYLKQHAEASPDAPFYVNLNIPEPHRPFRVCDPYHAMYRDYPPPAPARRWNEWEDKASVFRHVIDGTLQDQGWQKGEFRIPCIGTVAIEEQFSESLSPREVEEMRAYCGMISLADAQIGRVLEYLDEAGLAENTLVFFTADHGDYLGDHFLRSKGALHYEGCTRVPTVARWPGVIPAGQTCGSLLSNVDLAPTFLSAAGLPVHPAMQGIDQLPVLRDPARKLRKGVLVDFRAEERLYVNSWITETHRLSVYSTPDGTECELYDLDADPRELINAARDSRNADLVQSLLADMLSYRTRTARPWQDRLSFS